MLFENDYWTRESILSGFKGRSLLSTVDFTRSELSELLDLAVQQKQGLRKAPPIEGRAVALLFFNPSLRTRTSMAVAVQQLGGTPIVMDVGGETWALEYQEGVVMDGDKAEHIKDAAPVLSSYVDAIGVRCFPRMNDYEEDRREAILRSFSRYSTVPVLNLESATEHPLQALGDVMTIQEKFQSVDQRKVVLTWAYHPRALPMSVANSFALICAQFGMNLTIACPPEYELDTELMEKLHEQSGAGEGSVEVVHDMKAACAGAEVVYAKSWGSLQYYGRQQEELEMRRKYRDWIVTEELMQNTAKGYFMHCLPVRRNVVVTDGVLDGPQSVVVQQSANRMHVQKTLLSLILQG